MDFDSKPGLEFVKEFTVYKKSHDFYYSNFKFLSPIIEKINKLFLI